MKDARLELVPHRHLSERTHPIRAAASVRELPGNEGLKVRGKVTPALTLGSSLQGELLGVRYE